MKLDEDPWADLEPIGSFNVVPFRAPVGMDDMQTPPIEHYERQASMVPADALEAHDASSDYAKAPWPSAYDFFDEEALRPRRWIYGQHYLRSFVSVLASAGGIGKTSLQIVEALAIATGRPLLGDTVHEACPVWIVNLEDPMEEMQRRILAAMRFYGITPDEVRGRLFVDAGRDFRLKFARQTREGVVPNDELVKHLLQKIPERGIGAVFIDPFVGAHEVNENDNGAVNAVVAEIRRIADETECAIGLVHHIRKGNGEDADIDSVRGAGSLIGAARAARVINRMGQDEAERLGIDPLEARNLFRVDDGKANLAPPADKSAWRKMQGVKLANGEWVGVATQYTLPDLFDGISAKDLLAIQNEIDKRCTAGRPPRSSDKSGVEWVGHIVAEFTDLDATSDKAKIGKIVRDWLKSGALVKGEFIDEFRKSRPTIEVGDWASE